MGEVLKPMRVIAGQFRSQPLLAPRGEKTRPTSDRMRETLFNILSPYIRNSVFADLYAGSGAIGIEALSRGARRAYFAENARPALAALRANLSRMGIDAESANAAARIEPGGTARLLNRLSQEGVSLDLVFLDPPYRELAAYSTAFQVLAEASILRRGSIVVAEHSRRTPITSGPGAFMPDRTIEQGEAALTFFHLAHDSVS
jgi:16S rRNA (guanine(966)-N(2))-methyltransferase RsmD